MKKIVCSLIIAVLGLISSEAMAQPTSPTGTPPKCEDVPECKKCQDDLKESKRQLEDSRGNADSLKQKLDVCLGSAATKVTPPAPKPITLKCEGEGIRSNGRGGCECVEPDGQGGLVLSTKAHLVMKGYGSRVCVADYETVRRLAMDIEALKKLGFNVAALETKVTELYALVNNPAFKVQYDFLLKEVVDLQQRVGLLEQWRKEAEVMLQDHEDRITKLEGLNQSPWTTGVDVSGGALFLPGAGAQGFASLQWTNTVYFNKTTPVGLKLEAGAGRMFGNEGIGAGWVLDGSLGPVFNLYQRYVELGVFVTGKQLISDHGAGYQGVLEDPGMGFLVGPELELNINVVKYLDFGVEGGVGFAQANFFAGPRDLRQENGVGGFIGLHIGAHTELFNFKD